MTPEFVAEARRVYQPAAAWLRANGWQNNLTNKDLRLSMDYHLRGDRGLRPFVNVMRRTEWGTFLGNELLADVTSVTQAIDLLVTAGVLPVEFHSLSADLVQVLDENQAAVFQDDENGEIIHVSDGDEGPEGNGLVPLYRREPAGSVTT